MPDFQPGRAPNWEGQPPWQIVLDPEGTPICLNPNPQEPSLRLTADARSMTSGNTAGRSSQGRERSMAAHSDRRNDHTTATGVRPGSEIRFAFTIPNFGDFAESRLLARCAHTAVQAGWDAVLVWDALVGERRWSTRSADRWILLACACMLTSRIRLGTPVTPLPRSRIRRPAKEITSRTPLPPVHPEVRWAIPPDAGHFEHFDSRPAAVATVEDFFTSHD